MKVVLAFGFYEKGLSRAELCEWMWMVGQQNEDKPFEVICFQFSFIFVFQACFRVDVDMAKKEDNAI